MGKERRDLAWRVRRPRATRKRNSSFEERKKFWAFQPVKPQTPPAVEGYRLGEVADRQVRAGEARRERYCAPAEPADKMTLLRRVTFDLTGLPPTEQEMRAFARGHVSRCVCKGCGPAARLASIRREVGTQLA